MFMVQLMPKTDKLSCGIDMAVSTNNGILSTSMNGRDGQRRER